MPKLLCPDFSLVTSFQVSVKSTIPYFSWSQGTRLSKIVHPPWWIRQLIRVELPMVQWFVFYLAYMLLLKHFEWLTLLIFSKKMEQKKYIIRLSITINITYWMFSTCKHWNTTHEDGQKWVPLLDLFKKSNFNGFLKPHR